MIGPVERMKINQANIFYNYTIGFAVTDVDLLKTAGKLLKSKLTRAVCFSDMKCLYIDDQDEIQLEWVQPEGRQWDNSWRVSMGHDVPRTAATELIYSTEFVFHEQRIEGREARQMSPYLRAALPPIVLESSDLTLPLYAWIKVFSDGIVILSFQLDTTWKGIDEEQWISNYVNMFQNYFDSIWVDAQIQQLDADQVLQYTFQDEMSIAGKTIDDRKLKILTKDIRRDAKAILDDALSQEGREFEIGNDWWVLHKIAGSDQQEKWEATIELCRSQYVNAIEGMIVPNSNREDTKKQGKYIWQGRPSVSLMRFRKQPASKDMLLSQFGPSMSRILMRSEQIDNPPKLPPDLRVFGDYCLHGNQALLLWTWLRNENEPEDVWENPKTRATLTENQARAEHFEYHNMRVARACSIAGSSPSYTHLIQAYETLISVDDIIHHSSQSGEISDTLSYLMSAVGTAELALSGKERARWQLDKLRYQAERQRTQTNTWLMIVFGLVGSTGLADVVFKPLLIATYPKLSNVQVGIFSIALAALIVIGSLAIIKLIYHLLTIGKR